MQRNKKSSKSCQNKQFEPTLPWKTTRKTGKKIFFKHASVHQKTKKAARTHKATSQWKKDPQTNGTALGRLSLL